MPNKATTNKLIEVTKNFWQLVSGELDPYTSEKGKIEVNGTSVTLLTPSYIQFAKYGRGAGKKPPLDNILQWIKKNNIKFEGTDEKGTAFAIQSSIAKNGTLNYVKDAPNAIDEAIKKHLKEYNLKVGKIMQVSISDEIKENYKGLSVVKKYAI